MKGYGNELKDAATKYKEKKNYSHESTLRKEVRHATTSMRKRSYNLYLQTWEWREKRRMVFQRDDHRCVLCGSMAEHVHHLTYDRIFDEPLYDLVSLCHKCHEALHIDFDE